MGIQYTHALGREEKCFVVASALLTTSPTAPAATDAIKVMKTTMEREREKKKRNEKGATRDLMGRFRNRVNGTWSIEKYLIPSGAAGTAPDDDLLWVSGIGTSTNTPSTSHAYGLSSTQAPTPRGIWRHLGDSLLEFAQGALVEEVVITASGEQEARVKFSGACREIHRFGGTVTSTTGESSSATAIDLTTGHGDRIFDGAKFQIEIAGGARDTNGGAGYTCLTHASADQITCESLDAALIAGGNLWPWTPSETTAGDPIDGVVGSLTVDGLAMAVTSAEVSIKNNISLENDRYGTPYLADAVFGPRDVAGKISLRARKDMLHYLVESDAIDPMPIVLVIGGTAGAICTITMSYAQLDTGSLDVPEGRDGMEATLEIPFTALGDTAGENSIGIVFT